MTDFGRALLLRHGQTAWSRDGRHTGRTDLPLTPEGEEQARAAGRVLAGREFARCVVSPFARARSTADLAGLTGYDVDPDLAEWDYGPVEGLSTAEVRDELGYDWDIWAHGVDVPVAPGRAASRAADAGPGPAPGVPQGETVEDVGRRARAVVSRIEPVLRDGGDVLLVAHGHLLRVLTAVWLEQAPIDGSRFALATAAVSTLSYERDRHVLAGWNIHES
ncbi:putative phosphoglycerate mutase [Sediminihabitans luteus]|uniref:phosphoglycerate mutase (2,3-diphosphoglycerate-dependent) n=1 Tax=Sediminihabitans luteus TaxID=1138585 RepID=A0A2M9CEX5_9CELL|nr:histidine phosphatase family protein [Sediminihabitans luteus]PJJ70439.1 putative phosphoglycerate mutase [Sediminihabitans luteus]GII97912.1 phosphatase [Sediminihabitans luteus]